MAQQQPTSPLLMVEEVVATSVREAFGFGNDGRRWRRVLIWRMLIWQIIE